MIVLFPFLTEIWLLSCIVFLIYKTRAKLKLETSPNLEINQDNRTSAEILGLTSPFTKEDLKKAYRLQSTRFHPDKWNGRPEELKIIMEEEQKKVNLAYKKLS